MVVSGGWAMTTAKEISVAVALDKITDVNQVGNIVNDWANAGVQVRAYQYGAGTKRYYPAQLDAALTVVEGKNSAREYAGFGVSNGVSGSEVLKNNAIELSFGAARPCVTIGLGALFSGANLSRYSYNPKGNFEQAKWIAYSADGKCQACGVISGTANGLAKFSIQPGFDVARVQLIPVGQSSFSLRSVAAPAVKCSNIHLQLDQLVQSMASFSLNGAAVTSSTDQSSSNTQPNLVMPKTTL